MRYLDLCDHLDAGAIGRPGGCGSANRSGNIPLPEDLAAYDPVWLGEMADGIVSHEDDYQTFTNVGHASKGAALPFEVFRTYARKHRHHDDSDEMLHDKFLSYQPNKAGERSFLAHLDRLGVDTSAYRAAATAARVKEAFTSDGEAPPKKRNRYSGIRAGELRVHTAPSLIDDTLDTNASAMLIGPTGVGKTNLVVHLICCIAHGIPFFGRKTLRRAVALVEMEGARAVQGRIIAWHKHYGLPIQDAPILLIPESFSFASAGDASELIEALNDFAGEVGLPLGLVTIDTLHAASAGLNENDAGDVAIVLQALSRIRQVTGAASLVIHHTGLADTTRGRGSSAVRGSADTELLIEKTETGTLTLRATKQRDLELGKVTAFTLTSIQIGTRHDGKVLTAPVVIAADPAGAGSGVKLTGNAAKVWGILQDSTGRVAIGEITRRFRVTWSGAQTESGPRSAVARALDKLREQGLIEIENGYAIIKTVENQSLTDLLDSGAAMRADARSPTAQNGPRTTAHDFETIH